jgi:hypothetical protein
VTRFAGRRALTGFVAAQQKRAEEALLCFDCMICFASNEP